VDGGHILEISHTCPNALHRAHDKLGTDLRHAPCGVARNVDTPFAIRKENMRKQAGFTLIEIAIVLVIIGLLLGGILKGQELITGAKVRNLISQVDGVKAAFFGFQDRYRAYPGDYSQASINIPGGVGGNGNGNGRIEAGGSPLEFILVWDHLSHAGFITGTYSASGVTAGSGTAGTTNPANPYNVALQLIYDTDYANTTTPVARHNVKTGNQIPVEIIAEVDRKVDDGNANTGGFRGSSYNGVVPANCWNAATGAWLTTSGQADCGGASLL
jgi:prepilin-type N-terminal cleavage/methylation domain-containing protein